MRHCYRRFSHLVLGVCIFFLAAAANGASTIDEGKAAFEKGDYKTAIEIWQALIQEGRPDGLFFLGVMYAEGKGLDRDQAKAFQLYSEAAKKDHVPAQYNLGNQYATGEGVVQDFSLAEYWWTKAAERGLMHAQINLGNLYYHGVTGEKNLDRARKWLTLAANQGSPDAKQTLARLEVEMPQAPTHSTQITRSDATPRTSTDTLRREAWVLAQPSNHFTVQILATATDTLAQEFIRKHGLADNAAYVETVSQGTSVFRVVYGSFSSRELAEKTLAALPRAINANSPWVRSFAEIHKLVDRRYAERGAR
ncbi:MAG TPA: SPOR domain-containing protein [Burkholderiales bacterium]|nr:SPOR domain-containing protein [Burkholderiales bacterium]